MQSQRAACSLMVQIVFRILSGIAICTGPSLTGQGWPCKDKQGLDVLAHNIDNRHYLQRHAFLAAGPYVNCRADLSSRTMRMAALQELSPAPKQWPPLLLATLQDQQPINFS